MEKANVREYLKLNVRMFGKFQMMNEEGVLTAESIHSEMLTYMICYRKKSQTVQELIDLLWPENESDNPMGKLKNLMYRLRNLLKKTWGDYDFIITGRGIYQWNPQIRMEVDIEEFEESCNRLASESSVEAQSEKGEKAVELYRGEFLPELSAEYWVISMSTYYSTLYLATVKKLAALMEQEQRYADLEHLCRKELMVEPLDEDVHCFLLRALIAENKHQAAAEHYEKTVKYFYDMLGVRPSEEMQAIYEEMQKRQHEHESNIEIIHEELKEKEHPTGAFLCEYGVFRKIYALESRSSNRMGISIHLALMSMYLDLKYFRNNPTGAFLCEYGVFRKIYALESRSSNRMGISIHLALMSMYLDLKYFRNKDDYQRQLIEGMGILEKTLLGGLRNSDVICRYSANQFLLMLPACQYEDAKMVVNRLKDRFYQSGKTKRVVLQYSIDEIGVR